MEAFRRDVDGYRLALTEAERLVLGRAVADVTALLVADSTRATPFLDPAQWRAPVPAPMDPAVVRLLPDASRDDPDLALEFRRLTEDDLRRDKIGRLERLRTALAAPGDLVVPPSQAEATAAALTDVRLVLAERLGLRTDEDAAALYDELDDLVDREEGADDEPGPDDGEGPDAGDTDRAPRAAASREPDPRLYIATVYTALSWVQESLVEVMLDDLGDGHGGRGDGRAPEGD